MELSMNKKVSVIIPVIRPKSVKLCIEAIKKNADYSNYEIITEEDNKRIGVTRMVKNLVSKTTGDLIMYLGDDTLPEPGFMKEAVRAMSYLPDGWGMVALNDGRQIVTEGSHFLIDRRMLSLIGGEIFHTGYRHCFCDSELSLRAKLLKRYAYATNAKIKHNHPLLNDKIKWDTDYQRVYSKEWLEVDNQLFLERKKQILEEYETKTTD